jgi:hypothetical protein
MKAESPTVGHPQTGELGNIVAWLSPSPKASGPWKLMA